MTDLIDGCSACDGSGWVCETHGTSPWETCQLCAAHIGMPCAACNPCDEHNPPKKTGMKDVLVTRNGKMN